MKRILVVNANWAGDVLFSTPALRAIRKKFPDSFISCLAPPRVKNILKNNPHLNEVMLCSDRMPLAAFWRPASTAARIRKGNFDTAIFFQKSAGRVRLASWAGVRERIGFETPGRKKALTQAVPLPDRLLHRIDKYLYLLGQAGIPSDGRRMEFFPDPEAEASLRKLLPGGGPYVVLHAGGNWDLKRWPIGSFVQWIRLWRKEFKHRIVLCGTGPEVPLAEAIRSNFSEDEVLSLCGKTSFDELAFLLKNAELLLSNDSGPIHLAATQRTKIVGIFGPTSPVITGPVSDAPMKILWKDVGCEVPCYYRSCHYRVCMEWVKPEEVFEEARKLICHH